MGKALYRKYRPKSLSEVVGQEHITDALTKSLAAEWAEDNVRVNAIAPGVMLTKQTQYMFDDPDKQDMIKKWMDYTHMRRAGKPAELGGSVVFLCSDASSYITGHVLLVDGGYTIY